MRQIHAGDPVVSVYEFPAYIDADDVPDTVFVTVNVKSDTDTEVWAEYVPGCKTGGTKQPLALDIAPVTQKGMQFGWRIDSAKAGEPDYRIYLNADDTIAYAQLEK
jgi:hypothetical protein